MTDLIALEELRISNNNLRNLDLSDLHELNQLHCGDNFISDLKIDHLTKLQKLLCFRNELTSLSIPQSIIMLDATSNKIRDLQCSENPQIKTIY